MILTNKNKLQFTLDDSNSEGKKVIITVQKGNYCRDSKSMFIGGSVRLIKYPYNGINSVLIVISSYQESKCILSKQAYHLVYEDLLL